MPKLVNLPNGKQGSFPDEMSNEEIESVLQKQFPIEEKKPQSFFGKAPSEEEFAKFSGEVLRELPYVAQGAIKEPFKMANVLLPKNYEIPVNKLKLAEKISSGLPEKEKKEAESLGGMLGMGLPRAGIMGSLKEAQGIPHIGKVLEHAMKASPILNKLVDIGGRGAEFGLYEAAEHPENQLTRGALGFGLGAGLSGLGHVVPSIANKLGFGKQPGEDVIKGLKYEDVAPAVESAKRRGMSITPGEATGDPFVTGLEAEYIKTRNASKRNVELGKERVKQEKSEINNLLNTIYDKNPIVANDKKINKLYQDSYKWNLKPNVLNELKQDPLIDRALKKVLNNPAWQKDLKGVPENNYAYLDKTRDALWDKYQSLSNKGHGKEAKPYKDSWNTLTDVMDNSVDSYKQARALAERKITRNEIEEQLKKNNMKIRGSDFYKQFINNENKFDDLMHSLRNVPAAQDILKDMKNMWGQLINLPTNIQKYHQVSAYTGSIREMLEALKQKWNNFANQKRNVKAVEFLRGDEWVKKLQDAQKSGDKEKIENSVNDIMMKILPVSDFLIEGKS